MLVMKKVAGEKYPADFLQNLDIEILVMNIQSSRKEQMNKTFNLLKDSDWSAFLDWFLPLRGKGKLTVKVELYRKRRSTDANAYYWSVCIPPLAQHYGYRNDEMHIALLGTYTGWEEREFRGHKYYCPRRTTTTPDTMDTMDFAGLIQTAQQIAAEAGIILPDQEK